ncbi:MAG: hypothetical protein GC155_15145 [Alphaproteobacteria bacterium]|nr:hypothetical protein [Alphaproteobacteria bacterium]
MKRLRPSAPVSIGLTLAGVFALGASAPAWADRAVALSFQENPDYGRITAKWADGDETAPKISATVASQVLILKFDQKVDIDLDALKKGLPDWAALTRMDADGMTARIGLTKAAKLHISTSLDMVAVDLCPPDETKFPPDIVSPLVAKRAAAEQKARIAAIPPPPKIDDLEVRGSQSGASSRVAFYWPQKVGYKVAGKSEGVLKLLFAHRAKADLAYLHISPPDNVADFQGENTDKGYLVTVTAKDKLPIKVFNEGDVVVLDITRPAPPPKQDDETSGEGGPPAQKPGTPKAGEVTDSKVPAAPAPVPVSAKPERDKPLLLVPPKSVMTDPEVEAKEAAAAAEEKARAEHDSALGGPDRKTELSSMWKDPAPPNGVVDVKVLPLANGVEFRLPFAQAAPAAVFARGQAVWAVFAANADLKVDPGALPVGYRVRTMRAKNATMMRIEMPKGLTVSADAADAVWTVRLAPTATPPHRFLRPDRATSKEGRSEIDTMLSQAAGVVWFEDPVVGDQIAVAVSYAPSSASPIPRDFVEATLPATAHGLAVIPKSDDAVVTIESEKVIVSMQAHSQTAPPPSSGVPPALLVSADPAFVDFAAWGLKKGDDWFKRREKLEALASALDPATQQGAAALLNLARFYLGNDMPQEALGVLDLVRSENPDVGQEPEFLGMSGAANVMAHRMKAADEDLSKGALRNEPSAALWRGLIAVDNRDWERAADFFRQGEKQITEYSPERAAHFVAAEAETALNTNDYDAARRFADEAVSTGKGEDAERGQMVLAGLAKVIDGPAKAFDMYDKLAKTASEPVAVRAELKRVETGVAAGKLSVNEATDLLESLRYRWRGDDVEMETVGILADQYMNTGRFRDALQLAQSTAMRDPNAPGARDLRIRLSDYFRRLFLDGEVDRLDPIQALALFYEFSDLTPVGADGDQMIRKLAQRLVAFDLLDPAANLLQHQVDNRLRGVGQAAVAVDLAKIYLWNKQPDQALAAINGSRQPNLPKDLTLERRLLEAAAYRDMGRFDHAIELVENLDGPEAKSLLADSYWRSRQWPEAARTFVSMLPPPGQSSADGAALALRAAIAARMAKDDGLLADLRARYMPLFDKSPDKASFDLITAQTDVTGAAVAEAVKRLADAPNVDAFAKAMKTRFESDRKILSDEAAKEQAEKDKAAKEAAARAKAEQDAAAAAAAAKAEAAKSDADAKASGKKAEGKAADAGSGAAGKG